MKNTKKQGLMGMFLNLLGFNNAEKELSSVGLLKYRDSKKIIRLPQPQPASIKVESTKVLPTIEECKEEAAVVTDKINKRLATVRQTKTTAKTPAITSSQTLTAHKASKEPAKVGRPRQSKQAQPRKVQPE